MAKVAAGEKETVIKVGTGITIGVRNEGPYRINWADIDDKRYVHKEIYDNLDTKKKELAKKFMNIKENYGKLEKEWINEKNEKKDWQDEFFRVRDIAVEQISLADKRKRNFCIMAGVWLVTALILLIVI
jgi:DNA repair exonuclease SbcCD nuclease subunit